MLRLSKKADYALIALTDLASSAPDASCSAREIAGRHDVPLELMAKVLQRLSKRDLLVSHHGTNGGYRLSRPAAQISVGEVIQAIDGPILVTACSDEDESCEQYAKCNIRDPLWQLKNRIAATLDAFTLQELAHDAPGASPVSFNRHQLDTIPAAAGS